jgi:NADPH-dependent 2,4-dienoyl-CoA reductase/sulfur reductase-like enzyme/rhodanese-related sulfurtransferase
MTKNKILIVGGVAGGATAAAHARRLSEEAEIIIFERGPYVSFANCGLPYYVGGEIIDKEDLLVQTPENLHSRFNLDVRVRSEVTAIDPIGRKIEIRGVNSNKKYWESYDELILSTGAKPLKPPIPGIDRPGHFTVRGIPDVEAINDWIVTHKAHRAVVVGGGFIGLEMVEQLQKRGLQVSVVEALDQVMTPLDPEMAGWLHKELQEHDVTLYLDDPVFKFNSSKIENPTSLVELKSGTVLPADIVILGLGVRPDTELAKNAGLKIGKRGGIYVDEFLRTSDPNIWAIGDAIEVRDFITKEQVLIPLAGPANRQGRIVAENVFFGDSIKYPGTCGTSILRLFDLAVACTGANEKTLCCLNLPYDKVYLHPPAHATYYPGANKLAMKILFHPKNGKLLGAQIIGEEGVDKRIDVLATALKAGLTVHDLEDLELAYAPPFGTAKDPVNLAGMVAQHVVHHDIENAQWDEVEDLAPENSILLDVRDEDEREQGFIPDSKHISLPELRSRYGELPKDKEIIVYCQTGQRSYFACRFLIQKGFNAKNLSGAFRTWKIAKNSNHP